jgi:hypothetical protein
LPAATLVPLELTFFQFHISVISNLVVSQTSSYLMTSQRMKILIFGVFIYLYGFPTQFSNKISKTFNLCSVKVLSQKDSKFANLVLQGIKKALFFTSNATIL